MTYLAERDVPCRACRTLSSVTYLAEAGDSLDEDEEDDGPGEEEAESERPHDVTHVLDPVTHAQHLLTEAGNGRSERGGGTLGETPPGFMVRHRGPLSEIHPPGELQCGGNIRALTRSTPRWASGCLRDS